ncbi:HutD/Ves family protein [Shewanella sp. HL-SH2]|uniref:HutD/Ves family protein n=1 Tax=Shewanella sp. HL-SH2 TaxID=3436238 RepID=UPI003EBEFD20
MLFKFSQCQATPWKNGLGSTFQRYIWPLDADLDNFDVRISMARVQTNGPFSIFKGIDRHLSLLEGNGLRLTFTDNSATNKPSASRPAIDLSQTSRPYAFKGEWSIHSELIGSQVLDFNVMVRRGSYQAKVTQCQLTTDCLSTIQHEGELILLFLKDTEFQDEATQSHSIAQYDLLIVSSDIISHWRFKHATPVIITQLSKCAG